MHDRGAQAHTQAPTLAFAAMDDGTASGWAGVIAGSVYLAAQMMFVTVIREDSPWIPLQRISALLLGPDALLPPGKISLSIAGFAVLIHFALAFCYGRLIGHVVRHVRPAIGWVVGAVCGVAIYALNFKLIGELIFPWFAESQGAVTLFDHALFGVVAALSFITLRRGAPVATDGSSSG